MGVEFAFVSVGVLGFGGVFVLGFAGGAGDADEGDADGGAGDVPVVDDFEVVEVELEYLAAYGVGDEDGVWGGGDVGAGPEAGFDGFGEEAVGGCDEVEVVGVVHSEFAVAH